MVTENSDKMDVKKVLIITNGFVHDFAAGIWLAAMVVTGWLHQSHIESPILESPLNMIEHRLFWGSVAAAVVIMATGAGRTFTYVDNWYGKDAEKQRRKALLVKHAVLFTIWGIGYCWVWEKVFHS